MRQYQIQDYETGGATCPECGGEFSGRPGLSKHHAAQHGEKFKPLAACDWCGELYTETPNNLQNSDNHYCSEDCRKASFAEQRSGDSHPEYRERLTKVCDECGSEFNILPSKDHRRFCSRGCYEDWQRGRTPAGADGKITFECEWCGGDGERWPAHGTGRFCSPDCRHQWMASRTGEEHPLWQGGTDWYHAIRSSLGPTGWHTQRKEHLGDECELCGETEKTLSLHHIIPVLAGGTNAEYNYMTLCRSCHNPVERYTQTEIPGAEPLLVE